MRDALAHHPRKHTDQACADRVQHALAIQLPVEIGDDEERERGAERRETGHREEQAPGKMDAQRHFALSSFG